MVDGDDEPFMVNYQDIRESLALILAATSDPREVLTALDDAVSNNLGD